jgi:beta-phosphoglucomutase-like phosphatase (HAD superfamily)
MIAATVPTSSYRSRRRRPRPVARPPAVSLETLPSRWRASLDAAATALTAVGHCDALSSLPTAELARRAKVLASERSDVARLLDDVAREEHVHFRRPLTAPSATSRALGLPRGIRACIFDLDGVLTGSAPVHAAAWRDTFDRFLRERVEETGHRFTVRYFDLAGDYYGLIHGQPRLDGVRAFLESRGIRLPEGGRNDRPGAHTVHGLANQKQALFARRLARDPMTALRGASSYLEVAREARLGRVVVSPSANTRAILERAGLAHLVQHLVDGGVIEAEDLEWKPAPDAVLFACRQLDVRPEHVAVFETLPAGVRAARAAGVGFVVGVDRHGPRALHDAGADVVVADRAELVEPALAA